MGGIAQLVRHPCSFLSNLYNAQKIKQLSVVNFHSFVESRPRTALGGICPTYQWIKYTRALSTLYFVKGLRLGRGLYVFVETKNGSEVLTGLFDRAVF